ncbi:MAG: hypothetical protein Q9168_004669 [Polycauliona sp. 1 TL-2023]
MHFPRCLTILTVIVPTVVGAPLDNGTPGIKIATPVPHGQRSHVLSLNRKPSIPSRRSRYLGHLPPQIPVNATVGIAPMDLGNLVYTTNITFGKQTFEAIVDTGSSDTWLVESGFRCTQGSAQIPAPLSECAFGPPVTVASSPTFKQIQGQSFEIAYADGTFVTGIVGTEDVTLGGITVKNQEVGIVNHADWNGDNSTSGLIGLAFPSLTGAYRGNDPDAVADSDLVPYTPLFTSMFMQGLVAPLFSIAIDREGEETGGLLALGGLPPVNHSDVFACTPLKMTAKKHTGSGVNGTTSDAPQYRYYTIFVDSFISQTGNNSTEVPIGAGETTDDTPFNMHVDSGTSLIYVPEDAADAVNALFDPPAEHNFSLEQYDVDCEAKAPDLAVKIAGRAFHLNPADLIAKASDGSCFTGIGATYGEQGILGDVFMRNVVAVFDIGHHEMRFAAREFY